MQPRRPSALRETLIWARQELARWTDHTILASRGAISQAKSKNPSGGLDRSRAPGAASVEGRRSVSVSHFYLTRWECGMSTISGDIPTCCVRAGAMLALYALSKRAMRTNCKIISFSDGPLPLQPLLQRHELRLS